MSRSALPLRLALRAVPVGLVFVLGCGAPDQSQPTISERGSLPAAPAVVTFTAEPDSILEGDSTTLSWSVSDPNATLRITPLRDAAIGSTIRVSPVFTTTYTLTASNSAGSSSRSITVTVRPEDAASPAAADAQSAEGEWVPVASNLVGLPSDCGNLAYVSTHPTVDMVIAGVIRNGLWASVDGSTEWVALGRGGDPITNLTTNIVYDPADPSVWWESGFYGDGSVFRTTDNGATFDALGAVPNSDLVSIDFSDPLRQTLLSVTHERTEVHRSTDGGVTWEDISGGVPADVGFSTSVHVIDADTYLLGTSQGSESGVFRTTDGGVTWERVMTIGVVGRPLDASDGTIYWLLEGGLGMITSNDRGATWAVVTGRGPRSEPSKTVIELPDGRVATTGNGFVLTSPDRGATWQTIGPPLPFDAAGIAYSQFRNAYYAWKSDCTADVLEDSIVRLDLDPPDG